MSNTNRYTNEFLEQLEEGGRAKAGEVGNKIHVSELTSLPAFIYEKVRNIVDYKDEYLLRKNAIKRFLKRKLLIPQFPQAPEVTALAMVRDLILSRYLPNDTIHESVLPILGKILVKYHRLFNEIGMGGCDIPRWREKIIGMAAVECDVTLVSPAERNAYATYAYKVLKEVFDLVDLPENQEEKNILLAVAIQRVLERADDDIIGYYLLKIYHPVWFNSEIETAVAELAPKLTEHLNICAKYYSHRLGKRLLTQVKQLLVPFLTLRGIITNFRGPRRELFTKQSQLEHLAHDQYVNYWKATRSRIRRKGFHALVYIFITKMLLATLLELPYERFVIGEIRYVPLTINLLFPVFLMLVITLLIKSPGKENENKVVEGIMELVYGGKQGFYKVRQLKSNKRSIWRRLSYGLLYLITMGVSFGILVYILSRLGFNPLSGALFIFFVSLVSFFGISLRQQARQLRAIGGRETIFTFMVDFFTLPIVAFGRWLSTTFDKVNIFVFMLDFLFEMPFKTLLKIIDEWFAYLKEKKEEMY